jgi:hypothetical protein
MIFRQHMKKLFLQIKKHQCKIVKMWVREKYMNESINNPRPEFQLIFRQQMETYFFKKTSL